MRDKLEEQSTWNAIDAMKALEVRLAAAEAREAKLRAKLEEIAKSAEYARTHNLVGPSPFSVIEQAARAAIEETQRVG